MRVVLILALGIAAVAAVPPPSNRIIGGSLTTINQYPHMVALLYTTTWNEYYQSCGGTLLNRQSVLTAAHCAEGDQIIRWSVRVGSSFATHGGAVHNVLRNLPHPYYKQAYNMNNDISIMRTTLIDYVDNFVEPATIAGPNYILADNSVVWAAGWGRTSDPLGWRSEQLRHVQVWTVNQEICIRRYTELGDLMNDNVLCSGWLDVGGRDQCQGDSGSPLYHNGVVVGVCSSRKDCALPRYPGVNARVSRYTAWIQANA